MQPCVVNFATIVLQQVCISVVGQLNKSDIPVKIVTSFQNVLPSLLTSCDKQCEHNLLRACGQTCCMLRDFYTSYILKRRLSIDLIVELDGAFFMHSFIRRDFQATVTSINSFAFVHPW